MTPEVQDVIADAEDTVRRIGRGVDAIIHILQSPNASTDDAITYVADKLRADAKELVAFWEKAFELTR